MQLADRGIQAYLYSNDMDEVGALLAKGAQAAVVDFKNDDKLREIGIGRWVSSIETMPPCGRISSTAVAQ